MISIVLLLLNFQEVSQSEVVWIQVDGWMDGVQFA